MPSPDEIGFGCWILDLQFPAVSGGLGRSKIGNPKSEIAMSGSWFEITARVPPEQVEAVGAVMRDVAPGGVSVEDSIDILGPEMGFRVRPNEPRLIRAYLPSSELGAVLTAELRRAMEAFPEVELIAKPIYQEDWSVSWREFFGVVDTGGRIVIVPSWIDHEAAPGQIPIRLDPGQAFGTGHHETTRLCLSAIERLVRPGTEMLDVGTGSGVLAIAAVKLGARHVVAIDIDPIAAEVARANCRTNSVNAVTVSAGTVDATHAGRYDLVVANISTPANLALAPVFGVVVKSGGGLILSGILSSDAQNIASAMAPHGLDVTAEHHKNDWCLLELVRE